MGIENREWKFHFDVILPIFDQIQEISLFYKAIFYANPNFKLIFYEKNIIYFTSYSIFFAIILIK